MKTFIKTSMCMAVVSACAPAPPPTNLQVYEKVNAIRLSQVCIDTGRTGYLPQTLNYMAALRGDLSRATPAQITAADRTFEQKYPSNRFDDQSCRSIEVAVVQFAQRQANEQRQQQEFDASMDGLAASGQAMQQNALNSRPVTCQHYAWGNTTFCN